ncbi:hypothetical protein D0T56_10450 [Dysgonomonas sp. 520]|nr:hypothetical protein [Dysgonomonas sp. 520]
MTQEGKYIPSEWIFEQGDWRIKQLADVGDKNLGKRKVITHPDYSNLLQLDVNIPIGSDIEGTQISATYNRTLKTFFIYGLRLGVGSMDLPKEVITDKGDFGDLVSSNKKYFFADVQAGAQLPLKISSVFLIPNAKGIFGVNCGNKTKSLNCGFSLGAQVAYRLSGKTYLIGGIDFQRKFFLSQDYDLSDDDKFPPYNILGIHLGIAW